MSKTQYHFHPQIHILIVSCCANIHSSALVKNKMLSHDLYSAICRQSYSRVMNQTLAASTPSV